MTIDERMSGQKNHGSDYRYTAELPGAEGGSWFRAIEVLTGRPGIFGPDRPGRLA